MNSLTINRALEKAMPALIPAAVATGLLFSNSLKEYSAFVTWIFAFLTFSGSLGSSFTDLGRVVKQPSPIITNLLILHAIMPLIGLGVAKLFFPSDPLTIAGFVLLFAIPTGIASMIWVSVYKGHAALTLTLIVVDTLLSPFMVPATLQLLVGAQVQMDTWGIMEGLLLMVVLPSIIGMAWNQLSKGRIKSVLGPPLSPFSKIGLFIVIAINTAVAAPNIKSAGMGIWKITVIALVTAALGYVLGWFISVLFKWNREETVALTFNSGMRNLSAGQVLAVTYFPAPVVLPVIAGSLFQQLLATIFGYAISRKADRNSKPDLEKMVEKRS